MRFASFSVQFRYRFTRVAAAAGLAREIEAAMLGRFKQASAKGRDLRSRLFCLLEETGLLVERFRGTTRKPTKGEHPMIVNMSEKATEQEIAHIIERIREAGYQPHVTRGVERTIVAAVGSGRRHEIEALLVAPGVENVVAIAQPFKLVSRQVRPERTVVNVGGVAIGGPGVVVIAGPCSVESREQMIGTAHAVRKAGASMLRGGAYKPRTSPYDFQGLGLEALKILARGERGFWPAGGDRGDEHGGCGHYLRVCRHAAGGSAQYAELRAAATTGYSE